MSTGPTGPLRPRAGRATRAAAAVAGGEIGRRARPPAPFESGLGGRIRAAAPSSSHTVRPEPPSGYTLTRSVVLAPTRNRASLARARGACWLGTVAALSLSTASSPARPHRRGAAPPTARLRKGA